MKNLCRIAAFSLCWLLCSCSGINQEPGKQDSQDISTSKDHADERPNETIPNVDSLVKIIDDRRALVEANIDAPVEVSTEGLREKIRQKWQKIDFYAIDGSLVRIKTYPYREITNRTEEFYLNDGRLVLAVIEDDGIAGRGKPKDQLDKLYYFHNDRLIQEYRSASEPEYSLRESDGEELMTEFGEYLEIYSNRQKN